ncbi:MAG: FG-GAP repeat protein [Candidatus Woesearchaeota archaeon]|nr:MAG: FG-GAP repeat protein [Candidatus Woesearchaeota archaeon]
MSKNIFEIISGVAFLIVAFIFVLLFFNIPGNFSIFGFGVVNIVNEDINYKEAVILEEKPVERVVIGQPVKWIKKVAVNSTEVNIRLPEEAKEIRIKEIKQGDGNEVTKDRINVINSNLDNFITAFVVLDESVINNIELVVERVDAEEIEVEYILPGPSFTEEEIDIGKRIVISSDIHYENVLAFMDLPEVSSFKLYHVNESRRILVENITKYDENNNGLIDYIEWIIPSLSNQTYEAEITVIDVQSYPTVGGEWLVRFNTTGIANLTISASNGTTYGDETPNDLKFLNLTCGNQLANYTFNGTHVFSQDYYCNDTAYHTVQVLTFGKHTQQFIFGDDTDYANNVASPTCGGAIGVEVNISCANASWYGEIVNGDLGAYATLGIGNFNNDSFKDILFGAHTSDKYGSQTGKIYLIYGGASYAFNTNVSNANVSWYGETTSDNFGSSAAFGDINGDGSLDIIVAGPSNDEYGNNVGKIYLIYGGAAYSGEINISNANVSWYGENTGNQLGSAVGALAVGDVNNEGKDDIVVAAPPQNIPTTAAGEVYLIYGGAGYSGEINISNNSNASWYGEGVSDQLGGSLAVGDVNNDSFDDLVIASSTHDEFGSNSGKIYLIYGGAGYGINTNISTANASWHGEATGDNLGGAQRGVSIFDFNNDSFKDVIAGAINNDEYGSASGKVYLIYGGASYIFNTNVSNVNVSWYGENNSDNLGAGLYGSIDLNNDSFRDFLVAAGGNDEYGNNVGKIYLIYGGAAYSGEINISNANVSWYGESPSDQLGVYSIGSVSSFNNDSFDDLLIGAYQADEFGTLTGKVYLIYGNGSEPPPSTQSPQPTGGGGSDRSPPDKPKKSEEQDKQEPIEEETPQEISIAPPKVESIEKPPIGIDISEDINFITSIEITDDGLRVVIGDGTNIIIGFDEVFEEGRIKKKPRINIEFNLGEECKACLYTEEPFVVWPGLLIFGWIVTILFLLLLYKEKKKVIHYRKVKKKRFRKVFKAFLSR